MNILINNQTEVDTRKIITLVQQNIYVYCTVYTNKCPSTTVLYYTLLSYMHIHVK